MQLTQSRSTQSTAACRSPVASLLTLAILLLEVGFPSNATAQGILANPLDWVVSRPILSADRQRLPESKQHPWVSVKDPSIVRFDNQWHLFATLRKDKTGDGRIRIGYLCFDDWSDARTSHWSVLKLTSEYHGAPQIFFFTPQKKWYLVYQAEDSTRGVRYGPCFSTNENIAKPDDWTPPQPIYIVPQGEKAGLDYWVICDDTHAYLFFTSLNGKMWRARTDLKAFPDKGWSKPEIALQADIFEASHTYAIEGQDRFFTIVEAKDSQRRCMKAYTSKSLDGRWQELKINGQPFVSPRNVVNQVESWATSYSHGEFLRSGTDQRLAIDPKSTQLLFQGASDVEYQQDDYGRIPWRLGLLRPQN